MLTYIPLERFIRLKNPITELFHAIPVGFTLVKHHYTLTEDFYIVGNLIFACNFFQEIKPIKWFYRPVATHCALEGYRYIPLYGKQLRERIDQSNLANLLTSVIECDSILAITFVHEELFSPKDKINLPRNFKQEN